MPIYNLVPVDENDLEKQVNRAVALIRRSEKNIWKVGAVVVDVVGKYQVNLTNDIAERAGKDPSTIENWAHAEAIRRDLFEVYPAETRLLRRTFTPSHFWRMWEKRRKYNLSLDKVMHYFNLCLQFKLKGEKYSAAVLDRIIDVGESAGGNVASWASLKKGFQRDFTNVLAAPDTPRNVRRWLRKAPQNVKEMAVNEGLF